jgi:hypothetical protein
MVDDSTHGSQPGAEHLASLHAGVEPLRVAGAVAAVHVDRPVGCVGILAGGHVDYDEDAGDDVGVEKALDCATPQKLAVAVALVVEAAAYSYVVEDQSMQVLEVLAEQREARDDCDDVTVEVLQVHETVAQDRKDLDGRTDLALDHYVDVGVGDPVIPASVDASSQAREVPMDRVARADHAGCACAPYAVEWFVALGLAAAAAAVVVAVAAAAEHSLLMLGYCADSTLVSIQTRLSGSEDPLAAPAKQDSMGLANGGKPRS